MQRTLEHLVAGESATILRLVSMGTLRQRLLDMGLTPGTPVRVNRAAPMGDPIEISVKGYRLALRRTEARCILLREIDAA
jgi:Fe2+ transport system protein FeoA